MVFISILIPLYNGVEFLEQCINSVLLQTYPDWDLWIGINGHGSDGGDVAPTVMKLAKIDPRIHVVIQGPPLQGKVESLNHLVSLVSTQWIAVLDCDDIWDSNKLARQLQTMYHEAPNADVIGTFCRYFGESNAIPYLPAGYIRPELLDHHNLIINSSSLIKKEYCKWEYHETTGQALEDYYLWMKICLSGGTLYNIPEILTWHRIHKTSAFNSKGHSDRGLREWYHNKRITRDKLD
jgi:glycosyltransferase involved in cell wall biosynthesis